MNINLTINYFKKNYFLLFIMNDTYVNYLKNPQLYEINPTKIEK